MLQRFGVQQIVLDKDMDQAFPFVLGDVARQLISEGRPEWGTLVITVEREGGVWWLVRLRCRGERRTPEAH